MDLAVSRSNDHTSSESYVTSDNSSIDDSDIGSLGSSKNQKKKTNQKKSGINAKASEKVKFLQSWSHAYLQFELVNKQLSLMS